LREPFSNREAIDLPRAARVVALNTLQRAERVVTLTFAPRDALVPRACKPKNSLSFFVRLLPRPLRRKAKRYGKEIFGLRRRFKN